MNREAQILQALANRSLSMEARRALTDELYDVRAEAARRHEASRSIDFDAASAHLTPVQPHVHHTAETDWLGRVAAHGKTAQQIHAAAKAEASRWFTTIHPQIVADRTEFAIQATGKAHQWAGQWGDDFRSAVASFLQQAGHLAGFKVAECSDDDSGEDGEDGDSNGDAEKSNPPMSGEDGEVEDDDDYDGPRKESSRRSARLVNVWDLQPGDVLLRGEGATPDPENDTVEKVDGVNGMWIVDFTNGQSTPPLGNGQVYVASRRTVAESRSDKKVPISEVKAGDVIGWGDDPSLDMEVLSIEMDPTINKYRVQTPEGEATYPATNMVTILASRRTARWGDNEVEFRGQRFVWEQDGDEVILYSLMNDGGDELDRMPISGWGEDATAEQTAQELARSWVNDGMHLKGFTGRRRLAADGQTCSVCGDKIAQTDGSWHHDNGEKHDHEAKPGGSKESSRRVAAESCGQKTKVRIGNQSEMTVTCHRPAGHSGDHEGITLDSDDNPIAYRFSSLRTKVATQQHMVVQRGTMVPTAGPFLSKADADAAAEYLNGVYGLQDNYVATVLNDDMPGNPISYDEWRQTRQASRRSAKRTRPKRTVGYTNSYGLNDEGPTGMRRGDRVWIEGAVRATVLYVGFDDINEYLAINPEELGFKMYQDSYPVAVTTGDGVRIVQFDALSPRAVTASKRIASTTVKDANGNDVEWGYEFDDDYANTEGEPAVAVFLYDDNGEVLDAVGGVTLSSLDISDHGNVNISREDEAYCRSIAQDMAAARTASRRTSGGAPSGETDDAAQESQSPSTQEYTDESDFDVADDFDEGRYGSRTASVGQIVRDSGWSAPFKTLEGESQPRTRSMSVDALGKGGGNLLITLTFNWPTYEVRVDPYPGKVVAKGETGSLGIIEMAALDWIKKNVTPEWYMAEKEKAMASVAGLRRRASDVPSPSPESQNGYGESSLPDVTVSGAPEDTNLGWIDDDPEDAYDQAPQDSVGPFDASLRSARDRATSPRLGDQTACRFCGGDIEWGGDVWRDRGGNTTCADSGYAQFDENGASIPFPEGQKHQPVSDRLGARQAAQVTRFEDGHSEWKCNRCNATVERWRGETDVVCPNCGTWYNSGGQQLRDDWQGNESYYDDDISDLEGFERQQSRYESSLRQAADGDTSFCRLCGKKLEQMEYIWYPLKASPLQRDVGQHYCVPARLTGRPGEFGPDGVLVPGTPGGEGGQHDAPAGTIFDGGGNAIKIARTAGASSIVTSTAGEQFRVVGGSLVRVGWTIDDARKVLREKQYATVDGILLDATSANALVQAYDGLNPENRAKLESMSLDRAMSIVWKLFSKTGSDESGMEPDDTNLGWIAEGDPNAQDEFAFEAPDFPIANEASLHVGQLRIEEGVGYASGNPIFTVQYMPDNEDSWSYGVWENVKTFLSRDDAERYIADHEAKFPKDSSLHQAMPNPVDLGIQVGDIFYSSWGYDQTNVDFYQVVGLTGASVKVRQIAQRTVRSGGPGGDSVVAVPDHFVGEVMTKRIQNYSDRPSFSLNSYSDASLWDGTPKYQTGFGFGH